MMSITLLAGFSSVPNANGSSFTSTVLVSTMTSCPLFPLSKSKLKGSEAFFSSPSPKSNGSSLTFAFWSNSAAKLLSVSMRLSSFFFAGPESKKDLGCAFLSKPSSLFFLQGFSSLQGSFAISLKEVVLRCARLMSSSPCLTPSQPSSL